VGVLLYCNVDDNGLITDSIFGERIIPMRQYDYFFDIADKETETVAQELPRYRIVDSQLILEGQ
jgi:hypothetical protein